VLLNAHSTCIATKYMPAVPTVNVPDVVLYVFAEGVVNAVKLAEGVAPPA